MRRKRTRSGPWRSSCSSTRRTQWWSAAPVTSPCKARRRGGRGREGAGLGWAPLPRTPGKRSNPGVRLVSGPLGRVGDQEVRTCFNLICFGLRSGDRHCPSSAPPRPHTPFSGPFRPGLCDGSQEGGFFFRVCPLGHPFSFGVEVHVFMRCLSLVFSSSYPVVPSPHLCLWAF